VFEVKGKRWETAQSAWMCWREDGALAADLGERAPYAGYASILSWGENDGGAWVRYWSGHDSESMYGLDIQALRAVLIAEGEALHEQHAALAATSAASSTKHFARCVKCDAHICLLGDCGRHNHAHVAEAGGWRCETC
jgi:hypothetical protein